MKELHLNAVKDFEFVKVYDQLLENLFLRNRNSLKKINLLHEDISKATWLASIAALGDGDYEKNLANSFGSLLYLNYPENELYKRVCYILQSRTGNLLSSKHLPKIFCGNSHEGDYGTALNFELAANRALLKQEFSDSTEEYFTKFQKNLWAAISKNENVAISAPTSSGKSFIIKKFIIEKVDKGAKLILFIVPTKALINQVSNNIKSLVKDKANVFTTFIEKDTEKCSIYVLTPERTLKIFQSLNFLSPDLVFFDEIHNVEDSSRGAIFENSIYRMVSLWPTSQFIVAGPFIKKLSDSIRNIGNIFLIDHQTLSSPVFQLKVALTFFSKEKKANYKVVSPTGSILSGSIDLKKSIYSKIKNNKGEALEVIADLFSPLDHNIYYSPTVHQSEIWAKKISTVVASKNPDIVNEASQRVKDLINYLQEEVHPNYSLIRTLRLGVAYHNAGLPDIARQEVEELYLESHIKNIVCTSTLIQGVNLPADRLIVISPKVNKEYMENFDFMNLIGRAGRANTNLYGEIYCIDVNDDEWGYEKLTKDGTKTIESSSATFLRGNESKLVMMGQCTAGELKERFQDIKGSENILYLRSLFLTDRGHYLNVLKGSNISSEVIDAFSDTIENSIRNLEIPADLVAKNPFVDPILQNKLFLSIKNDGVDNWMFNKYPINRSGENSFEVPFSERSYYYQLNSIFTKLNEIFNIENDLNNNQWGDDYISINRLVMDAHHWMKGKRHRFFIDKKIGENYSDHDKVDNAARFVTKHISRNITFKAVKYLMLWSDFLSFYLNEELKEKNSYFLNIPSMLEMGSYDPIALELMSFGITRSVALVVAKKIRKMELPTEKALKVINKSELLPIYKRYLEKAGY